MFDVEKVLYGDWEEAKDVAEGVKLIFEDLNKLESLTINGKLLDIGCGDGKVLHEVHKLFPDMKYFGIDLLSSNIERAKKNNPWADIREGNFVSMPFNDETFDIVLSNKIFDYAGWRQEWPFRQTFNVEDLSKELYRVLKKDEVYCSFEIMDDSQIKPFRNIGFISLEGSDRVFQK